MLEGPAPTRSCQTYQTYPLHPPYPSYIVPSSADGP